MYCYKCRQEQRETPAILLIHESLTGDTSDGTDRYYPVCVTHRGDEFWSEAKRCTNARLRIALNNYNEPTAILLKFIREHFRVEVFPGGYCVDIPQASDDDLIELCEASYDMTIGESRLVDIVNRIAGNEGK